MEETSYYRLISRKVEETVVIAVYEPTTHAQGVWNPDEQHMAPATGILAVELEAFQPRDSCRLARLSLDIHGKIHFAPVTIETRVIRPGQSIEMIESKMISTENNPKERPCVVARAWRIQNSDSSHLSGSEDQPIPSFHELEDANRDHGWPGGYIASLHARVPEGNRDGYGIFWLTTPYDMVEGTSPSSFVRLLGLVDTANGISPRFDAMKEGWIYPNLDLQIHIYRQPQGQWLGLQTSQHIGADGIGLTSSILHDEAGPFGRSEQILILRNLMG